MTARTGTDNDINARDRCLDLDRVFGRQGVGKTLSMEFPDKSRCIVPTIDRTTRIVAMASARGR